MHFGLALGDLSDIVFVLCAVTVLTMSRAWFWALALGVATLILVGVALASVLSGDRQSSLALVLLALACASFANFAAERALHVSDPRYDNRV